MLRYRGVTAAQKGKLIELAQVPWDRFTLQGIRRLNPPFAIKSNQAMGWDVMNDVSNYRTLQLWIREVCTEVNIFPIHYEIAAWNKAH